LQFQKNVFDEKEPKRVSVKNESQKLCEYDWISLLLNIGWTQNARISEHELRLGIGLRSKSILSLNDFEMFWILVHLL